MVKSINANVLNPPFLKHVEKQGYKLSALRQKPLLVMYYDDRNGSIAKPDTRVVYLKLLEKFAGKNSGDIDILLHTLGGHPNTAYLLIQTIRKFANKITIMIPNHAYSGGTLMSLGSEMILMGPFASLGPIDLQINLKEDGTLPIIDLDKYVEFVKHTLKNIGDRTGIETEGIAKTLLKELTEEIRPTEIGHLFRLRTLSEYYARVLLSDYMFKNDERRNFKVEKIVSRLNQEYPDHGFDIDFNIAQGLGLKVELMDPNLFHESDIFLNLCNYAKSNGEICPFLPRYKCESEEDFRIPYIEVFDHKSKDAKGDEKNGGKNVSEKR